MSTITEELSATSVSFVTSVNDENASAHNNISKNNDNFYIPGEEMGRQMTIAIYPVIIFIGTIGNILTIFVMRRGSLKESSTCFYLAVLAFSDTCE